MFSKRSLRIPFVTFVIFMTMLGGLLFGACGVGDVDMAFEANSAASGSSAFPQLTSVSLITLLLLSLAALVLAAGRHA